MAAVPRIAYVVIGMVGMIAGLSGQGSAAQADKQVVSPPSTATGVGTSVMRCAVSLSRYEGEKRVSMRPFELLASGMGQVRVGIELPSGTSSRFVGTSIDCRVDQVQSGLYRATVGISDTALAARIGDQPLPMGSFTTFSTTTMLMLRDGQPLQFTVGTDPISGETTRAEVVVTAVK